MAGVDFDLGSYLHGEGDAWSLDGWDLAGVVPSARASDTGGPFPAAVGHKPTGEATAGLPFLDDRMLEELLGGHFGPPPTQHQQAVSTPTASECTTGGGPAGSRSTAGKSGSGAAGMGALQQQLDMLQQQQQQLQIPEAKAGGAAAPEAGSQPPACPKPEAGGSKATEGGSRKRRAEDPHVLEMAHKLLEARKTEQEAALAAETASLTADNHRLITYLKQLGDKLNKARTENDLLKRMVAENGAQDCALQAKRSASLAADQAKPAAKQLLLGITHSVADKVSALSVQRQVDGRNGAPLPCLRSTPLSSSKGKQAVKTEEPAGHSTEPTPASTQPPSAQPPGNPVNALVDLLRLVQNMQKQIRPAA